MRPAEELLDELRENNWRYMTPFVREEILTACEIKAPPRTHWGMFTPEEKAKIVARCQVAAKFGKECEAMA